MCNKRAQSKNLSFPIFSIVCYKNFIIVSGGGVGERYGYANQIVVYEKKGVLEKPLFELDTKKDCLDNLRSTKDGIIVGVAGGSCFILKIDDKGKLSIRQSFKCDETELRTCAIDSAAKNIYTGGEDKIVRAFELKSKGSETFSVNKRFDWKEHTEPVTSVDVSPDDRLVCSCSEDKSCRVYDAVKGIQLKKITFGDNPKAPLGLKISFCFFHKDEKHLLTIQNPQKKGSSYLTKWDLHKDCEPVKTIKLHNEAVTAANLDEQGFFLGCGTVDGFSKIVNTRYIEIDNQIQCHDLIVKGVSFLDDSRALGSISVDSTYYFLPNYRPEGTFSKFSKIAVGITILVYLLLLVKNNLLG